MAPKDTQTTEICHGCGQPFKPQQFEKHSKKCFRSAERRRLDKEYEAKLDAEKLARQQEMLAKADKVPTLQSVSEMHHKSRVGVPRRLIPQAEEDAIPRLETRADLKAKQKEWKQESPWTAGEGSKLPQLETRPKVRAIQQTSRSIGTSKESKMNEAELPIPHTSSPLWPQFTSQKDGHCKAYHTGTTFKMNEAELLIPTPSSPSQPLPASPQKDDIRATYHPKAQKQPEVKAFENFSRDVPVPPRSYHPRPWLPFHSESEFSFAEIVQESKLSNGQIDALIKVVHKLIANQDEYFLIKNHNDLGNLWKDATEMYAPFKCQEINVSYGKSMRKFEFWSRSLMDWARVVLDDDYLGGIAEFDAVRLEKFNGRNWVQFTDEPWTAARMWKVEDAIPGEGKPLCITLYADKTRLSSFGTAMGHPIMARIDNLPSNIRNGGGLGSTQVVGWIPIIDDKESEKNKPEYVNFKKAVYHACFKSLLSTIADPSKHGATVKCGQRILVLHPFIFILAADYEEQAVMTLTRGVKALYPCTVCLVPQDQLSNLSATYPLRTAEESMAIFEEAKHLSTKADQEALFKGKSLRNVENAFWDIEFSDPHRAVSFDELHVNDGGLGGKHLWPEARRLVKALGRKAATTIGQQMEALPPWQGLNHFNQSFLSQHFADGNKFRDIMKMFIFASHNVLGVDEDSLEYMLLRCFRGYINMVMWQLLEVHTSETIAAGRKAVTDFGKLINTYDNLLLELLPGYDDDTEADNNDDEYEDRAHIDDDEDDDNPNYDITANTKIDNYKPSRKRTKKHNFPKAHNETHSFDDIEEKGILRGFTTRLFEGRHGSLKCWYQNRSNFKDVAPQVLTNELRMIVSHIIREYITAAEEAKIRDATDDIDEKLAAKFDDKEDNMGGRLFNNIYLGSPEKACSFDDIEETYRDNPAFHKFQDRCVKVLKDLLKRPNSPATIMGNLSKSVESNDPILIQHKFIKATYESLVDWRAHTDYLRAHPTYHGIGRFDCVILDNEPRKLFARLLFVFTVTLKPGTHTGTDDVVIPLALVQPFSEAKRVEPRDKDLRLLRLRATPGTKSRIVPARSIIRGAYIVSEGLGLDTSLIVDVVDSDMFLRIQEMYPL